MKKSILAIVLIAVAVSVAMNFKWLKRYHKIYFGTDDMFVAADNDAFDKGLPVGARLPLLNASYQGSPVSDITTLSAANGLVLVVNRSLEWCPYCMRQTIELQNKKSRFDEQGISIVVITYDSPEVQQTFINRHSIEFPILSDIGAESFKRLDVLRDEYGPDHNHYGLPYPGMFVVDNTGYIRAKLFIEAYSYRVDTEAVLSFAMHHLQ